MTVDIENETLKQELREGLLEAVSFGSFCHELAGAGLETELRDLEAAAHALHSAALVRLGA
jgi:hypothetical protein